MMGKIPKYFIQELLERTNIIDLINLRFKLKKIGENYQALCPFHHEKHHLLLSIKKQFFYCFGCKVHGNAIDFLMEYEKLNFLDSITELSTLHNIIIPFKEKKQKKLNIIFIKKKLHTILSEISNIYQKNLFSSNPIAYQYLLKRGISKKIIYRFLLGYATFQNNQIKNYIEKKKLEPSILLDSGLIIINKEKKFYDRFRNRIMFPIRDKYGNINGFGGRKLNNINQPKYLNSSENPIFYKNKNLYGIYELTVQTLKPKQIIVVEGYFDVLSLAQYNIYAVALLGTVINSEHCKKLFQISDNIIFCYDGDHAGKKTNWITLNLILPFLKDHRTVKFIFLPENEDPSSIILKEGEENFKKEYKNPKYYIHFLFNKISKNMQLGKIEDRIQLSRLILPLINKIPGKNIKIHLQKLLGEKTGILDIYQFKKLCNTLKTLKKPFNTFIKKTPIRLLISLLLQNPELAKEIKNIKKINKFHVVGINIFVDLLKILHKNPNLATNQLIEYYRNSKLEKIFKYLIVWNHMIGKNKIYPTFLELLKKIKIQNLEYKYTYFLTKERKEGLNITEKKKLWKINQKIVKHKI
ncbi:DNA primase [Buchnera aphidicola (Cinara tujafilina)]|uniref:DNA primase n=1 Tax=Buchnera aphidicola (Cinara tujafilina) TaxID=261317 RepID=F7WYX9_9GAMM|nr:DNA primase [Buchnera aphidicola]AEH39629.1 DNA primase [Buchnera aphidicola (Cinara tujafilina)]